MPWSSRSTRRSSRPRPGEHPGRERPSGSARAPPRPGLSLPPDRLRRGSQGDPGPRDPPAAPSIAAINALHARCRILQPRPLPLVLLSRIPRRRRRRSSRLGPSFSTSPRVQHAGQTTRHGRPAQPPGGTPVETCRETKKRCRGEVADRVVDDDIRVYHQVLDRADSKHPRPRQLRRQIGPFQWRAASSKRFRTLLAKSRRLWQNHAASEELGGLERGRSARTGLDSRGVRRVQPQRLGRDGRSGPLVPLPRSR